MFSGANLIGRLGRGAARKKKVSLAKGGCGEGTHQVRRKLPKFQNADPEDFEGLEKSGKVEKERIGTKKKRGRVKRGREWPR